MSAQPPVAGDALHLPDARDLDDLAVLVGRARRLDPDGAVRLTAHGSVLAVHVAPLTGPGLPVLLGLRAVALAAPSGADVVVALSAVADRLARRAPGERPALPLPPVQVAAPWAGVSPPRGGWELRGEVDERVLTGAASAGVREVADGAPSGAGGHAVERLRGAVWSRPVAAGGAQAQVLEGVPAGAALVADALGFLAPGELVRVAATGAWRRLSTARGHVLARPRLL